MHRPHRDPPGPLNRAAINGLVQNVAAQDDRHRAPPWNGPAHRSGPGFKGPSTWGTAPLIWIRARLRIATPPRSAPNYPYRRFSWLTCSKPASFNGNYAVESMESFRSVPRLG